MEVSIPNFDYSVFDPETREFLRVKETLIKIRTNQTVIENGRDLSEAKGKLNENGELFHTWVESAIGIKFERAYEYIRIYKQFGSIAESAIDNFQKSSLILLSSPSTPPEAKRESIARAESGEKITHKLAKEIQAKHKKKIEEKEARIKELEQPKAPNLDNLIPQLLKKYKGASITIGTANRLSVLDEGHQKLFLTYIESSQWASKEKVSAIDEKLKALEDLNKAIKERDEIREKLDEIATTDTAQIFLDKEQALKKARRDYDRRIIEERNKASLEASQIHERLNKDKIHEAEAERDKAKRQENEWKDKAKAAWDKRKELEAKVKKLEEQFEVDNPTNVDNARVLHIEDAGHGFLIGINELRKDMILIGGGMDRSIKAVQEVIEKASLELAKLVENQDAIINI